MNHNTMHGQQNTKLE